MNTFIFGFKEEKFNFRDHVYREGDTPEKFYIVRDGEFTVTKKIIIERNRI